MEITSTILIELIALGFVVGILAGTFGVGGGFLITPLIGSMLGLPYTLAVGSSLASIIGTSLTGIHKHWRMGNIHFDLISAIGGGTVAGTLFGTAIHKWLREFLVADGDSTTFELTMIALYAICLTVIAIVFLFQARAKKSEPAPAEGDRKSPPPLPKFDARFVVTMTGIGLSIGTLSGLLGLGGGILIMPALVILLKFDQRLAVATSLGAVFLSAVTGTWGYAIGGFVSLPIALSILVGGIAGVQVGGVICQRISGQRFRSAFLIVIVAVIALLAWKATRILTA